MKRLPKSKADTYGEQFTLKFAKEHFARLGLPTNFDRKLRSDDDWSLVVKLHALIEAAMTDALVVHIGKEGTRDLFSRLSIGGRSGKVAFAKALNCGDDRDLRFVQKLSELRNQLVHDVRNVGFTLAAHIKKLSISERRVFVRSLFYLHVKFDASEKEIDKAVRLVRRDPKYALWFTGLHATVGLYLRLSAIEFTRSAGSARNARK
jgi:hypothetical protein